MITIEQIRERVPTSLTLTEMRHPDLPHLHIVTVWDGYTVVTIFNQDMDLDEQIEGDTCAEHGVFLCSTCFDLST